MITRPLPHLPAYLPAHLLARPLCHRAALALLAMGAALLVPASGPGAALAAQDGDGGSPSTGAAGLCADRPGLDTAPCVVEPGVVQAEIGLADWSLDRTAATRSDTISAGDILLRYGVGPNAEVRVGWQAFGTQRTRDRASGAVARDSGTGDLTLGAKINLAADGEGPVALLPQVSVPTGSGPVGAGTWSAGLLVPMSFTLSDAVSLAITPEVSAAADADGRGRHFAGGTSAGLGFSLTDTLGASAEMQLIRDDDPAGATTQALAGAYLGWQPAPGTQFDVGAQFGLNRDSPDVEFYLGYTRRM